MRGQNCTMLQMLVGSLGQVRSDIPTNRKAQTESNSLRTPRHSCSRLPVQRVFAFSLMLHTCYWPLRPLWTATYSGTRRRCPSDPTGMWAVSPPRLSGGIHLLLRKRRASRFGLFKFNVGYEQRYYLRTRNSTFTVPVQVGKYNVLRNRNSRRRVVAYDCDARVLSVPVSCRPPLLIDRGLTLCSGLLPCISNRRLEYQQVPTDLALTTSVLLRQ